MPVASAAVGRVCVPGDGEASRGRDAAVASGLRHGRQSTDATDSETLETPADELHRHRPATADNATSGRLPPRPGCNAGAAAARCIADQSAHGGQAQHVKWKQSERRGGDRRR